MSNLISIILITLALGIAITAPITSYLDNNGLGFIETVKLLLKGKLKARLAFLKLKQGDIVFVKHKGVLYPVKILINRKHQQKIEIYSDTYLGWNYYYSYDDLELLDQATAKALYGGK